MSDQEIIEKIREGDRSQLDQVYKTYRSEFIYWVIKEQKCPMEEAKDIYQVAIAKLFENIVSNKLTNLTSTLKTYIFSIGKNKVHEYRRRENIKIHDLRPLNTLISSDMEEVLEYEQKITIIGDFVGKMKYPCAEILKLFYFNKNSMEQICGTMGYKNVNVAKNQKYKCMEKLRNQISEHFNKVFQTKQ
ncbi:RNA polymerase sigma factor [Flexithrix dorotheae]|uniref:RNA polymerase sigma factor n=1 Tax=Flexithrix dorotheae TaxID=70993 RepID=UPI00035E5213|nr:sigma-70 family RNA polymerase sigma factor [Flexithrix dorotheae]